MASQKNFSESCWSNSDLQQCCFYHVRQKHRAKLYSSLDLSHPSCTSMNFTILVCLVFNLFGSKTQGFHFQVLLSATFGGLNAHFLTGQWVQRWVYGKELTTLVSSCVVGRTRDFWMFSLGRGFGSFLPCCFIPSTMLSFFLLGLATILFLPPLYKQPPNHLWNLHTHIPASIFKCSFSIILFFLYLFFFLFFLLLFNYSCMPFLPIPPPHPMWTNLHPPSPPSPLVLSMCPL